MTKFYRGADETVQTTEVKRGDVVLMSFKSVWPTMTVDEREEVRIFLGSESEMRTDALQKAQAEFEKKDTPFDQAAKRDVVMGINKKITAFVKDKLIRCEQLTDSKDNEVKYNKKQRDLLFADYDIRMALINSLKRLALGVYYDVELEGNSETQATSGQAEDD